uniref:Uncharacterized protein n=1 Tax=Oryza barthii TaxID=65489 RepID=A0A0D3HL58_9ORYZ
MAAKPSDSLGFAEKEAWFRLSGHRGKIQNFLLYSVLLSCVHTPQGQDGQFTIEIPRPLLMWRQNGKKMA